MSKLFSFGDIKNHPRRSGFSLSNKNAFTAKSGELLPVYWKVVMPGDKFNIRNEWFTRTQPVNTAAYTRVREYFDWFYVPFHLLWRHFPEVVSQMQGNVQHANSFEASTALNSNLPYLSLQSIASLNIGLRAANTVPNNQFGFDRADLAYKLLQYLGYGPCNYSSSPLGTSLPISDIRAKQTPTWDMNVNLFPLLSYNKICEDYFRYNQWQKSAPYLYNVDYYTGNGPLIPAAPLHGSDYYKSTTMLDLKYCNWNKDIFMGVMPDSQYGPVAAIDLGITSAEDALVGFDSSQGFKYAVNATPVSGAQPSEIATLDTDILPAETQMVAKLANLDVASFNILQLRMSEALQKWKEVSLCSSQNYKAQIKAHFGVELGDHMSGMSTFIDGFAQNLDISEVVNTNITPDSEALIAGKGISSGNSSTQFEAKDWGIIMCIYHNVPLLDYTRLGQDPQLYATVNTDLPIPELDSVGMEALPLQAFVNNTVFMSDTGSNEDQIMGYLPRYYPYKTSVDVINGAFTTTMVDWAAPIDVAYVNKFKENVHSNVFDMTYQFFKVDPSVLDTIFGVKCDSKWDTDQFLVNCNFDVKVVRNLDYNGMPY